MKRALIIFAVLLIASAVIPFISVAQSNSNSNASAYQITNFDVMGSDPITSLIEN